MDSVSPYDAFIPFFPVHDLSATRDFYGRELGLEIDREQGRCLIFRAAHGYLGFCLASEETPSKEGLVLSFLIPDVDTLYGRLRALGTEVEDPPRRDEHYRIYHFFARDPDGYHVEFRSFLEAEGS